MGARAGRVRALARVLTRDWARRIPWLVAAVLFVVLLPTSISVLGDYGLSSASVGALALAQTVPLLLAPVRPLPAWVVILGADVLGALVLLTQDVGTRTWPFPATVIVGYVGICLALGLREPRRTLLTVWATTAVAELGLASLLPEQAGNSSVLLTVLGGAALVLGAAVRERSVTQRLLTEQESISAAERSRRTLLEERARIARELHDVVAHHMSVITVQADTAAYRLDGVTPEAREEFESIAATARSSLGEMRRLLGVLRSEETSGELVPQPGLADVGRLVEATTRAGVPVSLSLEQADLPASVGLSAYRIVQEALANVVRHAPGASAEVTVTREDDAVRVVVGNGPSPRGDEAPIETTGTGHGLVGMRERVRLVGGTLDVGPRPDGGFRVAASLPVRPDEGEAP
ncbi:signal transduction histidine kinase [Nocardioides cavernae]|uniref:histidine kinase n=1 Tax=Nocardioides cavernae TaxID=1921566 RepID=A0A7Y9KS75_9ACTN|nr:sensor histidine kinase [Nocardioides cavernae]NYE36132.1 signal transduction histidine kinase [Nocardioides cavernae]